MYQRTSKREVDGQRRDVRATDSLHVERAPRPPRRHCRGNRDRTGDTNRHLTNARARARAHYRAKGRTCLCSAAVGAHLRSALLSRALTPLAHTLPSVCLSHDGSIAIGYAAEGVRVATLVGDRRPTSGSAVPHPSRHGIAFRRDRSVISLAPNYFRG